MTESGHHTLLVSTAVYVLRCVEVEVSKSNGQFCSRTRQVFGMSLPSHR